MSPSASAKTPPRPNRTQGPKPGKRVIPATNSRLPSTIAWTRIGISPPAASRTARKALRRAASVRTFRATSPLPLLCMISQAHAFTATGKPIPRAISAASSSRRGDRLAGDRDAVGGEGLLRLVFVEGGLAGGERLADEPRDAGILLGEGRLFDGLPLADLLVPEERHHPPGRLLRRVEDGDVVVQVAGGVVVLAAEEGGDDQGEAVFPGKRHGRGHVLRHHFQEALAGDISQQLAHVGVEQLHEAGIHRAVEDEAVHLAAFHDERGDGQGQDLHVQVEGEIDRVRAGGVGRDQRPDPRLQGIGKAGERHAALIGGVGDRRPRPPGVGDERRAGCRGAAAGSRGPTRGRRDLRWSGSG